MARKLKKSSRRPTKTNPYRLKNYKKKLPYKLNRAFKRHGTRMSTPFWKNVRVALKHGIYGVFGFFSMQFAFFMSVGAALRGFEYLSFAHDLLLLGTIIATVVNPSTEMYAYLTGVAIPRLALELVQGEFDRI